MTTLFTSDDGELCLTLRGAEENRILTTLRRWPHWRRADVEPDPEHDGRYLSVTLVTDPTYETTLREILKRSFGMTFPPDGGSSQLEPEPPSNRRRGH